MFFEKLNFNKPIVRSGPNSYNRHDYLRFDCGDFSQCNARFSYMHALFPWNKDLTNSPIQRAVRFRDKVLNICSDSEHIYNVNNLKLYSLNKILFYPSGAGFMNEHTDGYNNLGHPNFLIALSRRGQDYSSRGGYYVNDEGDSVNMDKYTEIGDLYAHIPNILHGVHTVDNDIFPDLNSARGRYVVNISLEKVEYGK